jgi:hypothetical protein
MSAARGDNMAALADHLARLLQHADKLLREWQAHADGVRARLDAEGKQAGDALARAIQGALADVSAAGTQALQRTFGSNAEQMRTDLERARQAASDLEAHLKRLNGGAKPTSVDEIRAGIAGLASQLAAVRAAVGAGGRGRSPQQLTLILAVTANLLLITLITIVLLRPTKIVTQDAPPRPPDNAPSSSAASSAPVAAAVRDAAPPPPPAPANQGAGLLLEAPPTAA